MTRPASEPSNEKAQEKVVHKADYRGATPKQVAEAVLRYRPPSEGPKPEKDKRWL